MPLGAVAASVVPDGIVPQSYLQGHVHEFGVGWSRSHIQAAMVVFHVTAMLDALGFWTASATAQAGLCTCHGQARTLAL